MAAAALAFCLAGCTSPPPPDPTGPTPTATGSTSVAAARLARTRSAVDALVQAARDKDRAAFDQLVSLQDPSFGDRARLLYTNVTVLPLAQLRIRLDPRDQPLSAARQDVLGAGAWMQRATVTWQLTGDSGPAEQEIWLTFVDDGAVRLAGTIDEPAGQAPAQRPSWWVGPVTAHRSGTATAVSGAGQSAQLWANRGDAATRDVRRLLPEPAARHWNGRVVIEAPASERDFEAVLGVPAGTRSGIAAVAQPEGTTGTAAIRVVVNPRAAALLSADQLSRVLEHEIVHVATRAADSPAPTWAEEGLAEWVSLRDRPGQRSWGTADLLRTIREDGPPRSFPGDSAFAVDAADLNRAYAEAWLACRLIADRYSPVQLAAFAVELDRGRTVNQASREALGVGAATLTRQWQTYLTRLAR